MNINDNKYLGNILSKYFNIDSIIKPNEAYTEYLAVILYLIWYNKFKISFNYNNFNRMINNEIKWSLYQTAKIIYLTKCMNKFEDLYDPNINCKLKQKTSVFSYYILKTILLFNFNLTNYFILEKLNNSSIKYNSNYNTNFNFLKLINIYLKNNYFNKIINKIIFLLSKNKKLINYSMIMVYLNE